MSYNIENTHQPEEPVELALNQVAQVEFLEEAVEKFKTLMAELKKQEPCGIDKGGDSLLMCIAQIADGTDIIEFIGEPEITGWWG